MTAIGTVQMIAKIVRHSPRYRWLFAPPQWSLHYAAIAARLGGIGLACISDELTSDAEAVTPAEKQWRARERRAHQRCAFTIALSDARGAFIRNENRLGPDHAIFTVPNSAPGPAARLRSHYYQDILGLDADQLVVLHRQLVVEAPVRLDWYAVQDWDEDECLCSGPADEPPRRRCAAAKSAREPGDSAVGTAGLRPRRPTSSRSTPPPPRIIGRSAPRPGRLRST